MKITPSKYLVRCAPGTGGGQCRCVQITPFVSYMYSLSIEFARVTKTRRDCDSRNHIIRQNSAYTLSFQVRVPRLPNNREHSEGSPSEAKPACTDAIGVYSDNKVGTH
jgi:hypothetical protein